MAKKEWMVIESELDEDQIRVLMAQLDKSLIISGCAGSGKSVLALIKARRIQKERGNNYQIIVYTKALCGYMNAGRETLGLEKSFQYHWRWKNKLNCPPADYTIVDEIQDFDANEIKEFIGATNKNFFFFGDTAQSVYGDFKKTVSVADINYDFANRSAKEVELYRNYRLPLPVARAVQYVGVDLPSFEESIYKSPYKSDSFKPKFVRIDSLDKQIDSIISIIWDQDLTDVAILVPTNDSVDIVCAKLQKLDIKYEFKSKQGETLNFETSNLKVMTYHSAKGLQFETVFIPNVLNCITDSDKKALYVAMTRTWKYLYLFYSYQMPSVLSRIPENLYKTTLVDDDEEEDL